LSKNGVSGSDARLSLCHACRRRRRRQCRQHHAAAA
jgi:hypothetical protein